MKHFSDDQDYIFLIIEYLLDRHNINFFITSKDFDILYGWWEKRIPLDMIRKSIDNVCKRRGSRGKPVDSFMNFSYEVRKNLSYKLDLNVNAGWADKTPNPDEKQLRFFENFPEGIKDLEAEFLMLKDASEENRTAMLKNIYERLISKFKDDDEMNVKTMIFMGNLPPPMNKPEIVMKFKINYLNRRFNIPDFE